jgi:hypothetical protein|tara:strand:+ start:1676 stop:2668 length:993 start_codon:yes stop_codon:yes gene_type:complete
MVRTGAYAYVNYGFESTIGGSAGAITKSFGLKTAVNSLTVQTNRVALGKLGQVEPSSFAYGAQTGNLGISFVLGDTTSHDIFQAIYGAPTGSGTTGAPYVYGGLTQGNASKTFGAVGGVAQTFTTEIGFNGDTDYMVRSLKGCILNSLNLTTSIGETVNCSADSVFGKEDAPSNSSGNFSDDGVENSTPFTFAHGTLKVGGLTLVEVQDVDITFAQNGDLLYGLGSQQTASAVKKTLEITGRFRASWKNDDMIDKIMLQLKGTTYAETVGGSPEFELFFSNGASSPKSIKITLSGLAIGEHSVTGLEPVEPVFEEITWQAKTCKVDAVDQ